MGCCVIDFCVCGFVGCLLAPGCFGWCVSGSRLWVVRFDCCGLVFGLTVGWWFVVICWFSDCGVLIVLGLLLFDCVNYFLRVVVVEMMLVVRWLGIWFGFWWLIGIIMWFV